jgi:hypothetical protein
MADWPELPLDSWRDSYETLHMWSQAVGKICLELTPKTNHNWNIAFHFTATGLTTPVMHAHGHDFTIAFNFVDHRLEIACADGKQAHIKLEPKSVADFYREVMETMRKIDLDVKIWTMPVEVPNPIRFEDDTVHRSYNPERVNAFWRALLSINPVFEEFRCGFVGKCSPLHFFWGSFDLALTRFSGKKAPPRDWPEGMEFMAEAYSHEVISAGFWPGSGPVQEPAFYAYAAPAPEGFAAAKVSPSAAYYQSELGEFILPYDAVRSAPSPENELRAFLDSTYEAAASLADWNRAELER